jgi:hypothetical protein
MRTIFTAFSWLLKHIFQSKTLGYCIFNCITIQMHILLMILLSFKSSHGSAAGSISGDPQHCFQETILSRYSVADPDEFVQYGVPVPNYI